MTVKATPCPLPQLLSSRTTCPVNTALLSTCPWKVYPHGRVHRHALYNPVTSHLPHEVSLGLWGCPQLTTAWTMQ